MVFVSYGQDSYPVRGIMIFLFTVTLLITAMGPMQPLVQWILDVPCLMWWVYPCPCSLILMCSSLLQMMIIMGVIALILVIIIIG